MSSTVTADRGAWFVAATLLLLALVFGGGLSGRGDSLVHAMAVLALGVAWTRFHWRALGPAQKAMAALLAAAVALALLQMLPLPAGVFERLPGRAQILAELGVAGVQPGWLAMSVDRWGTLRALVALVSFSAMWMLCTTLTMDARVRLLKLAVLAGLPLALLGFAQASMKSDTTGASALFFNRSHFATLMAMLLPLAFAAARDARARRLPGGAIPWLACAVVLLLAAAMTFSRAGFLLACLATVGVLVMQSRWRRMDAVGGGGVLLALVVATLAIGLFAFERLGSRIAIDLGADLDSRWALLSRDWALLQAWLPWGSGLGSFATVFASAEPVHLIAQYVVPPYAHDELLQVGIEAGWPGLLLAGMFVVLVGGTAVQAFLRPGNWRIAAVIAALVPLLHSLVDYPLRAFACSLLLALLLSIGLHPDRPAAPSRGGNRG